MSSDAISPAAGSPATPARFFHASPYDLRTETHLLPPSRTGREPHWDDMTSDETDLVFVTDTLEAARGWGSDLAGQYGEVFHVYEVSMADPRPGAHGIYSAATATIVRHVLTYEPATDQVHFSD